MLDTDVVRVLPANLEARALARRLSLVAWMGMAILILVNFTAMVDHQLVALLTVPMQKTFGVSDTQIGLLQGVGYALVSGIAALPAGAIADRFDRRVVLAVSIVIWSVALALCGVAPHFDQLFIATVIVGVGQAALVPVIFGLIPDMFDERQRVIANAVFGGATMVSIGASLAAGGALLHAIEMVQRDLPAWFSTSPSWRLMFIAMALPAPVLAILVVCIRTRKSHSPVEKASVSATQPISARAYFSAHGFTLLKFLGAVGLSDLAFLTELTWAPTIAVRLFGESPALAGGAFGTGTLVGSLAGCVVGVLAMRYLAARHGSMLGAVRVWEYGTLWAVGLAVMALFSHSATFFYAAVGFQVIGIVAGTMLLPTIIQDVSPPHLRSRVAALVILTSVAVRSCGPILVGVLSDHFGGMGSDLLYSTFAVALAGLAGAFVLMRSSERRMQLVYDTYSPSGSNAGA